MLIVPTFGLLSNRTRSSRGAVVSIVGRAAGGGGLRAVSGLAGSWASTIDAESRSRQSGKARISSVDGVPVTPCTHEGSRRHQRLCVQGMERRLLSRGDE